MRKIFKPEGELEGIVDHPGSDPRGKFAFQTLKV